MAHTSQHARDPSEMKAAHLAVLESVRPQTAPAALRLLVRPTAGSTLRRAEASKSLVGLGPSSAHGHPVCTGWGAGLPLPCCEEGPGTRQDRRKWPIAEPSFLGPGVSQTPSRTHEILRQELWAASPLWLVVAGHLEEKAPHPEARAMWGSPEVLLVCLLVLAAGGTEYAYRPGRRVCAVGAHGGPISESFVQRVYQPFLTTCDGHRACSTYRTIYRTAYRRSPGLAPARPQYSCCPGWKRTGGLPGACGAAICQPPCRNGGSCIQPGHCRCPAGWQGDTCQSDVDECRADRGRCPQRCVNTAGSYWCQCWEGHSLSADGTFCVPKGGPPRLAPNPTGVDSAMKEEVQRLQSRVDLLEEKLQLVLAPLHSLASQALELGLPDPGSLLVHSLQQLGRIDSLSEQISFLEEQLGSCSCKKDS
nr:epidermal growth factor-like protein 7 isoform X2 [Aotus nancymaae]